MLALLLYYVEETLPSRPRRAAPGEEPDQPFPDLGVSELTRSRQAPRDIPARTSPVRSYHRCPPSSVSGWNDRKPISSKLLLDPLDVWRRLRVAGD